MKYLEKVEWLETFIRLLEEPSSAAWFLMSCAIRGYGEMMTPECFQRRLLPFLVGPVERSLIKYKLRLRRQLPKLQAAYREMVAMAEQEEKNRCKSMV